MLIPLLLLALGAVVAGCRLRRVASSARAGRSSGRARSSTSAQPPLPEASSLPPLGGLGAAGRHRDRLRRRLVGLHRQRGHGRADRRPRRPRLELPLQQVVLRRALRRDVRARRQGAGRPVLEGRRPEDHRWTGARRRLRTVVRSWPPHRPVPDRLRLPLRLRHAARRRWRCSPTACGSSRGGFARRWSASSPSSPSCRSSASPRSWLLQAFAAGRQRGPPARRAGSPWPRRWRPSRSRSCWWRRSTAPIRASSSSRTRRGSPACTTAWASTASRCCSCC